MTSWVLHQILPSTFWGWIGSTSFLIAAGVIALYMSGGSKLVASAGNVAEAALQPVAAEAGKLTANTVDSIVTYTGKGLTGIGNNPVVLWPMLLALAVLVPWGIHHYTESARQTVAGAKVQVAAAKTETKATTQKLATCTAQQKATPKLLKRTPQRSTARRAPVSSAFDFTSLF